MAQRSPFDRIMEASKNLDEAREIMQSWTGDIRADPLSVDERYGPLRGELDRMKDLCDLLNHWITEGQPSRD